MGIEHGAWCVGCCWGLMLTLFAVGVMSITWTVVIAALIAVEKLLPWPSGWPNRGIALLLIVLARRRGDRTRAGAGMMVTAG